MKKLMLHGTKQSEENILVRLSHRPHRGLAVRPARVYSPAPPNKLLTTAFEASFESVMATCKLSVDNKITGIA